MPVLLFGRSSFCISGYETFQRQGQVVTKCKVLWQFFFSQIFLMVSHLCGCALRFSLGFVRRWEMLLLIMKNHYSNIGRALRGSIYYPILSFPSFLWKTKQFVCLDRNRLKGQTPVVSECWGRLSFVSLQKSWCHRPEWVTIWLLDV